MLTGRSLGIAGLAPAWGISRRRRLSVGGGGAPSFLASDEFAGADGTLLEGRAADTGQIWTHTTGAFALDGTGKVKSTVAGTSFAYLSVGAADVDVTVKNTVAGDSGIAFRVVDGGSYLDFRRFSATQLRMHRVVVGGADLLGFSNINYVAEEELRVVCLGSSVKYYRDGVLLLDIVETTHQTATKFGIRGYGLTEGRLRSFKVAAA